MQSLGVIIATYFGSSCLYCFNDYDFCGESENWGDYTSICIGLFGVIKGICTKRECEYCMGVFWPKQEYYAKFGSYNGCLRRF
ncbi:hypothetical protein WN48_00017 [Eufriesea mexicana]|uniref:Uncharacterized protein n=1 Tax=Eufriesea mexicana TaxID=516756 RepID=A0A310SVM4_9HYME|nr:hypothetical protein WN48_00017 [Eufriesea mexicana]